MQVSPAGFLETYNSLTDENLAGYFANPRKRRYLRQMGLISHDGRILDEETVRLYNIKREHKDTEKQRTADALAKRAIEIEKKRRAHLRMKMEQLIKLEKTEKVKFQVQHPPGAAELTPTHAASLLPPRLSSTFSQHKDELGLSPSDLRELGSIIHQATASRSLPAHFRSPYSYSLRPRPPSAPRPEKKGSIKSRRLRIKRPGTAPTRSATQSLPDIPNDKLHSNIKMTLCYLGEGISLDSCNSPTKDLEVLQQHCGGNTIRLFKGKIRPGEKFTFTSKRHIQMPLGISIYTNNMIDCRLSSCCEYKHQPGHLLGSRSARYKIVRVSGGKPCYRCSTSQRMAERIDPHSTGSQVPARASQVLLPEVSLPLTPTIPVAGEEPLAPTMPVAGEEPLTPTMPMAGKESPSDTEATEVAEKKDCFYQYEDDEFEEEDEEEQSDKQDTTGASEDGAQEGQQRQDSREEQETESASETASKEQESLSSSSFDQHPSSPADSAGEGQRRISIGDKGISLSNGSTKRRPSAESSSAQASRRSSKSSPRDGSSASRKSSVGSVGSHSQHQARRKPSDSSPIQTTTSISEVLSMETTANTGETNTQESQVDTATGNHTSDFAPDLLATKERDQPDDETDHTEITTDDQSTADTTTITQSISEELASQEESNVVPIQADDAGRKKDPDPPVQEHDNREVNEEDVKDNSTEITIDKDTSVLESIADSTTAPESVLEDLTSQTEVNAQEGKEVGREQEVAESPEVATGSQDTLVQGFPTDTETTTKSISKEMTSQTSDPPSHTDHNINTMVAPDAKLEKAIEDTDHGQEVTTVMGRQLPLAEPCSAKAGTPEHSSSRHSSGRSSDQSSQTSIRAREEGPGSHDNSRRSSTVSVKETSAVVSHPSTPARRGSTSRRSSKSSVYESVSVKPGSSPHHAATRRLSKSSNTAGETDHPGSPLLSSPAHSNKSGSQRSSRHSVGEEHKDRSRNGSRKSSKTCMKDWATSTSAHDISGSRRSSKSSLSDLAQLKLGNSEGSAFAMDSTSKPAMMQDAPEAHKEREFVQVERSGVSEEAGLKSVEVQLGNGHQTYQHRSAEKVVNNDHSSSDPAALMAGTSALAEETQQDNYSHKPSQGIGEIVEPVSERPTSANSVRSTTSENAYVSNVVEQALQKATETIALDSAQVNTYSLTQEEQATVVLEELVTATGLNHAESEVSLPMDGENSGSKPASPASGRQNRLADRSKEEEQMHHATSDSVPLPADSNTEKHSEEQPNKLQEHENSNDLSLEPKTEHPLSSMEHLNPCQNEISTQEHPNSLGHRQPGNEFQPGETPQPGPAREGSFLEEPVKSANDESASHEAPHKELHKNLSNIEQDRDHPEVADQRTESKEEQQGVEKQGKVDSAAEKPTAEQNQLAPETIQREQRHAERSEEQGSATILGELLIKEEEQRPSEVKSGSSTSIQSLPKTATLLEDNSEQTNDVHQRTSSASTEQLDKLKQSASQRDYPQDSNTPIKPSSDGALRSTVAQGKLNELTSLLPKDRRVHSI